MGHRTRLALGATRGALVRQLVGEGILIAALGTAGAVLAFSWIGGTITQFASWWRGPALHPVFDLRLFIFAAGSLLLVGIGFSLFPALSATNFQHSARSRMPKAPTDRIESARGRGTP